MTARAWLALAALLAAGSLVGWFVPAVSWDWQPALALQEPWRWFTAAFVHWSPRHLAANLVGCALVAALGAAGGLGRRAAIAWALAWPLGHLGLLLQPALAHYGGLSGVLHAGVAVAGVSIALAEQGRRRTVALLVLAGLALKIVLEEPWGPPLTHPVGWDIAVAPLAHATGALAGGVVAVVMALLTHRRQSAA